MGENATLQSVHKVIFIALITSRDELTFASFLIKMHLDHRYNAGKNRSIAQAVGQAVAALYS